MNHIGSVIRECREMLNFSRKKLSKDICSEKYLYMIENGDRTPSSIITFRLGDRMGVDIFKYYEYLDCAEPIQVCNFIERFLIYRIENDFPSLIRATKEALCLKDFREYPWRYEIELNNLAIKVFCENNRNESISILISMIPNINFLRINRTTLVSLYVLLSTCYQMNHDLQNARKIITLANETISGRESMAKFVYITTLVKINKITLHYLAEEFENVIDGALELLKYGRKMHYCEYLDHASFYLAFAYYQSGEEEKGVQWFHKALSMMLINYNPINMRYIMDYKIFDIMMLDKRLCPSLIKDVKDEYNLMEQLPSQLSFPQ